jgi:hypothetical protein
MTAILTDLLLFVCIALLMTGFMVAAEAWSSRRQAERSKIDAIGNPKQPSEIA